jgi:hypothetical protein
MSDSATVASGDEDNDWSNAAIQRPIVQFRKKSSRPKKFPNPISSMIKLWVANRFFP